MTAPLSNNTVGNFPKTDSKENLQQHLYVLILAGGGGTRLWPLSRDATPKQFLKLFGGKSLFKLALERAYKLTSPSHIYIATSAKYHSLVKKEAPKIPGENIISEPIRRDTALAQGIGALYIYHRDPQAVIINFASDHLISPVSTFVSDMKLAAAAAYDQQAFVTVGIKPLYPHTGMGHIKFQGTTGLEFVEKPPLNLAQKFTQSGHYYWNANLYVWPAKLLLDLLKKHAPKTYSTFPALLKSIGTSAEKEIFQRAFQMAPTISIDYAVSEHLRKFVCLPARFSWTDVGDWHVAWQNLPQDSQGNAILAGQDQGQYVGINSQNNLLILDKQLITTVGLKDMLVVDTPDAILICPKDDAQAVKKVVEMLKEQGLTQYL